MTRLAFALLVLLTAGAAAADDAKSVRAAFASGQPFVLVGVPADFLTGAVAGDDVETQGDWAYYLNGWHAGPDKDVKLVVVPIATYRATVETPEAALDCITLFVRKDRTALVRSDSCVLLDDEYEEGAQWMRGEADAVPDAADTATLALKRPPRPSRTGRSPG